MVEDLLSLIEEVRFDEIDIVKRHIKDFVLTQEDMSRFSFKNVIFENCKFINCNFEKSSFIDVLFESCDLSNSNFCDGYFNTCEFISCKAVGISLQNNKLQQLFIKDCNFNYSNWDSSLCNGVSLNQIDMSDTSITECVLKNIEFDNVEFMNTNFFKTLLKDIDLTKCKIGKVNISSDYKELRGAVISHIQAVDLVKLLGVVVK